MVSSAWGANGARVRTKKDNTIYWTAYTMYGSMQSVCYNIVSGHKFLVIMWVKKTTASASNTGVIYYDGGNRFFLPTTNTTEWQRLTGVYTLQPTGNEVTIYINDGRASDWDETAIRDFMIFDLTAMYGEG